KSNFYLDLATGFILGGACGNLIDRIYLGYVIDYLDFIIWPVFNLADSILVIGSGLLLIYLWKFEGVVND
ncbi:MAG: signal peptidase II, partial [Halanaerobiaceae bacterium]